MGPVRLNRRRFLGCSAAAGLAMTQAIPVEGSVEALPVRVGLIGLGNRGTSLLRSLLELPGVDLRAVCDLEPKHRQRAQGIAQKATGRRPEALEQAARLVEDPEIDAVVVALPCDLHFDCYRAALRAGKHLYAEKPLALTVDQCDELIRESARRPDQVLHVGFQRRSNPRYREGVELLRRGELGTLIEARFAWSSSNGPIDGHAAWLSQRERSGDWMLEQAVHIWDVLNWIAGGPPERAYGHGRRLFTDTRPSRDVTDHYSALLEWPNGFTASFVHSWVDPADDAFTGTRQHVIGTAGGLDLTTGIATFRDRSRPRHGVHRGAVASDSRAALSAFLDAVRAESPGPPPLTLAEARDATLAGLLVRKAVDERRVVTLDEIKGSENAHRSDSA